MSFSHLENELRNTGDPADLERAEIIAGMLVRRGEDLPLPQTLKPDQVKIVNEILGEDMNEYSYDAQASILHIYDAAQSFNHQQIESEHVLLGILSHEESPTASALTRSGIRATKVRTAIDFISGRGDAWPGSSSLSPSAQDILQVAQAEKSSLGHAKVDSSHLFVAMLRDHGKGSGILESLGINLQKTEDYIRSSVYPNLPMRSSPNNER